MKNVFLTDLIAYYNKRKLSIVYDSFDSTYYLGQKELTDSILLKLLLEIETEFQKTLSIDFIMSSIKLAALSMNSCQSYLNSCHSKWDGTIRIDNWLSEICGLEQDHYSLLFQSKFLIGAVARAMSPGCKMDNALILEGPQGIGKSSLFSFLFGRKWFTDAPFILGNKDSYLLLRKKWVVELAEMKVMSVKNSILGMKGMLSQLDDTYRLPYGRMAETFPRKTIFVGTTNEEQYLSDPTGNRRYWPVYIERVDQERLLEMRDQLWGEACHRYRENVQWWFDISPDILIEQVSNRNKLIDLNDTASFTSMIEGVLNNLTATRITTRKLMQTLDMQEVASPKINSNLRRVAENAGWKYTQVKDENGSRVRGYKKLEESNDDEAKPSEFNFV